MIKISVIGAGFVGATTAFVLAQKQLGDIVLVDILDSVAGKGLDMLEAMPNLGSDSRITGTTDFSAIKDSSIIVVTAGFPRKPGMSREDLLEKNAAIVKNIAENVKKYATDAILITVTNPLDVMTYLMWKETGFDKSKVIGMAGLLDTARMKAFIAEELKVNVSKVDAIVLGGHGDSMVPVLEKTTVDGKPVQDLIAADKLKAIVERTQKGGGEIVKLLGTGSAYYAPASSIAIMVEAIINDDNKILPCSVLLEGEYGYQDIFLGVPVKLGVEGLKEIVEWELEENTKMMLDNSAGIVEENTKYVK